MAHLGGWLGKKWKQAEDKVSDTLKHYDHVLRSHNAPDMYIGVNSTDDGKTWNLTTSNNDGTVITGNHSGGYNYGNVGRSNTTAYKANAAGTANKIAQGGMTKDDILKYNMKHPNEIAGDNPANTTALNTNTAIRSN